MEVITRKEARELGLKRYFTGKPCKHGHTAKRQVSDGNCIECAKIRTKKWVNKNLEHRKEYQRKYLKEYRSTDEYKEHFKEYHKNWRDNNRDKTCEYSKNWREKNPDYQREWVENNRERSREIKREWKKRNQEYERESSRKFNKSDAGKFRHLISKTVNRLSIDNLPRGRKYIIGYSHKEFAKHLLKDFLQFNTLQDAYNAGYEVDHIVPLNFLMNTIADKVLRFKVAMDLQNLQLLTKTENLQKFDRMDLPIVQNTVMVLSAKYDLKGLTNGCS